jgi:hypothetical protein
MRFPELFVRSVAYSGAVVIGATVFTAYGYRFCSCSGASMLPTIPEKGAVALIDKFTYNVLKNDYQVGDVVVSRGSPIRRECETHR